MTIFICKHMILFYFYHLWILNIYLFNYINNLESIKVILDHHHILIYTIYTNISPLHYTASQPTSLNRTKVNIVAHRNQISCKSWHMSLPETRPTNILHLYTFKRNLYRIYVKPEFRLRWSCKHLMYWITLRRHYAVSGVCF